MKQKVNLDFEKQYACGEEPSDSDDELVQSSSSSNEGDSPVLQLPQIDVANIQAQLVTGDIFLLGGSHVISTDVSSSSSDVNSKISRKRKTKKIGQSILEEDEKFEEEHILPKQTQQPDRSRKLAEREAYLKRPPNQTVTLIKSKFANQ